MAELGSLDGNAAPSMTVRLWIRIIGAIVAGLDLMCLPSIARSPRSYISGFAILLDAGSFIWIALVLIILVGVVFLASFAGSK